MVKKLLLTFLFLTVFINANAARIYVDANATGSNNGSSWVNAYTTIEDALNASIIGDEIWIRSGIYKPSTSNGFDIPSGIKVYGSFAGTETSVSERDLVANTTTLNGDIGVVGNDFDNANHVVIMTNVNNQTRLDGFRIINGYANNVLNASKGGGLYNLNGSPTIANCIFISNYSNDFGGAIVSEGGNIIIEDCDINNNTSVDTGGGVYFSQSGTGIIRRTKINTNTCTLGSGGGVSTSNGVTSLIMDRCEISGNTTQDFGGAAVIGDDTSFSIYNSVILGNISDVNTIYMHTTFNTGSHEIINCTFSGNNLVNNTSGFSTTIRVTTSTTVSNSVFWDNDAAGEIYRVGAGITDPSVNNCLIDGGFATGTGNIDINPNFSSPAIPAFAPFSISDGYDYSLSMSSPAIDSGDNGALSPVFNLDFLGNARIFNGTVDMGAYEDGPLSVGEVTGNSIKLYPNPAKEFMILQTNEEIVKVELYDISGRKLSNNSYSFQNSRIDFESINTGVYLVKIYTNSNAIQTSKVIITK
jgi:hypothetical protein